MERPDPVIVLTAIKPVETDGQFFSPELKTELEQYSERQMWAYYLLQEEGGIEEERAARELASFYLLKSPAGYLEAKSIKQNNV